MPYLTVATDEAALAFESEAARYEAWYKTRRGRRADRAEQALIRALVGYLGPATSVLDIGCGTGHFVPVLEGCGFAVFGLDQSASMLRALRVLGHTVPLVLGDAQALPLLSRSVSVSVMVTTLEFIPDPELALVEAIRVATNGLVVVALHRRSLGGIRRRFRRSPILSRADDLTIMRLRTLIKHAAGDRLEDLRIEMALPPLGRLSLAFGDIVGAAVRLSPASNAG